MILNTVTWGSGGGTNNLEWMITGQDTPSLYENSDISYIQAFGIAGSINSVSFPNVTSMGSYAFAGAYMISGANINLPKLKTVPTACFVKYVGAIGGSYTVSLPSCITIGQSAFQGITTNIGYGANAIKSVYAPNCTTIGSRAFYNNTSVDFDLSACFPKVTTIQSEAFGYTHITKVVLSQCFNISDSAFRNIGSLSLVSLPECLSIRTDAFINDSSLAYVSIPKVKYLGQRAFATCMYLSVISLPMCSQIGGSAFATCTSLEAAYICWSTASGYIGSSAFRGCFKLLSVYVLGSNVISLSSYALNSTPIDGYTAQTGGVYGSIFVPASLLASYQTATRWSAYSARFVSLTDAEVSAIKAQMGL